MGPWYYEVVSFDGDYVNLRRTDIESDELNPVALALLPGQGLFPTHGSPAGRRGFFLPYHTASLLSGSVDLAALRSGPAQSAQNRPWTPR